MEPSEARTCGNSPVLVRIMITMRLREFAIVDLCRLGWEPGSIAAALLCTRWEIRSAMRRNRQMDVEGAMYRTVCSMIDAGLSDAEMAALLAVPEDMVFMMRMESFT